MGTVAKFEQLPLWFVDDLREDADMFVLGRRWVSNGHVLVPVNGATWGFDGMVADVLAKDVVTNPLVRLLPMGPIFKGVDATDEFRNYIDDIDAYTVPMGAHNIAIALRYYGLIQRLFGIVEWYGTGPYDAVIARRDGELVAVVMPIVPSAEEGEEGNAAVARLRALMAQK